MNRIIVEFKERSYPILIDNDLHNFYTEIKHHLVGKNVVIVTDSNVGKLYLKQVVEGISQLGYCVFSYIFKAGEESKSLKTVNEILTFLLEKKVERDDCIIALGGGVTGDLAGYIASIYLRGINFIQFPTTLLSQVDSSVGGKVGVNFDFIKNVVGSFYQPILVCIYPEFLKSLSERDIKNGLAEIIVHCIIANSELFEYIDINLNSILKLDYSVMNYLISENCKIKSNIVKEDEKDTGVRAILNFGHTIGHAIEACSEYNLYHGEAVSIGIRGAFLISLKLGLTNCNEYNKVMKLLNNVGLPITVNNISSRDIFERILHDKKKFKNVINFVLPLEIGRVKIVPINDKLLIMTALDKLIVEK